MTFVTLKASDKMGPRIELLYILLQMPNKDRRISDDSTSTYIKN